ncbi:MAG: PfkB family carbohydrate kinase [Firmicutes bacterium]|nr:PfkB family carbohydrate kinase [Bacillota bacterium]
MKKSAMKKILVIGSTVADIIIELDRLPVTAEDVHVKSQSMSLGGCAHNVADMLRHFDVPFTLFSPVGTGLYADFVRKELTVKGMESPISVPDRANGCCYCFVEASGERTFVVDHGAEYLFEKEWFDRLDPSEYSAAYICGLEIEEKTGSTIVDFLERSGLPVFFAPGPRLNLIDPALMDRIFALHPVLHLNRDEICSYTGCPEVEDAAKTLFVQTKNTVIITKGADGACFFPSEKDSETDSGIACVPPFPVSHVEDTIGAGDGHCGAVMACLARGLSLSEALTAANAVSAKIVSVKGALLSQDEFDEAISSIPTVLR